MLNKKDRDDLRELLSRDDLWLLKQALRATLDELDTKDILIARLRSELEAWEAWL